jgi:hypothetical protein
MDSDPNILDLPEEWIIDPREALYNDYLDGVFTAEQTLCFIDTLSRQGLLSNSAPSKLWHEFVSNLEREVQERSKL